MGKVLAVMMVLLAALSAAVISDTPQAPAELTWIEPSDIHTLDPQRMSYIQDFRLAYALYEGLVRWDIDSDDFHVVPAAAERWGVSDDGLTYTFHLDPRGKWSNGEPVRAEDFLYSWRRALMPDTAADYTQMFFCIAGAQDFFDWRQARLAVYGGQPAAEKSVAAAESLRVEADERFGETVGIEAVSPLTLRVTLMRPTPYFLSLCAFGPFLPVHRGTVEGYASVDAASGMIKQKHGWTKPGKHVGNGPYLLKLWRFKRDMRLEKCPLFRDPSLAKARSLQILMIEDQNTSVTAFESGAADWHADVDVTYIGDLLDQAHRGERDDIHAVPAFGTYFWSFNCTPRFADGRENPFFDARVRRAFALAIDKRAIVDKVRRSGERVATTLIPPGSIAGFESPRGLEFDVAAAKAEFAAAGWIDRDGDGAPENARGERFPVVELLCTPAGPHRDVAQAMSGMWERALGVQFEIAVRETKTYRNTLKRRDYMLARGIWYGDFLDPTTFLDLHKTGDGNNDRGFSDAKFDDLLERALRETDVEGRMRLLEEAERYASEEALPVIPIWHFNHFYMFKPPEQIGGLRGISTHPRLVQYPFMLQVNRPVEGGGS